MVRRRRSGGFTLVELLIAMGLSMVGLLGLLALQSIAIRGNMMSRNFGEAIGIAQQRLEIAQRTPYASLSALAEGPSTCLTTFGGTSGVNPNPDASNTTQAVYTRCTQITVNADNTTNLKVKVWWRDERNRPHSIELDSKDSP
jgi:Tfp pilus assembly protein PilV